MVDFRLEKFNNYVKKIIGDYLSKEFYNEGSTIISILNVDTSKDFSFCKILVSIFWFLNTENNLKIFSGMCGAQMSDLGQVFSERKMTIPIFILLVNTCFLVSTHTWDDVETVFLVFFPKHLSNFMIG